MTETFGNVILEAMASALPVVTVRGTALAEHVHRARGGILVNKPDPQELAEALLALCQDSDARQRYAANARRYACTQSWERHLERQLDIYEKVLRTRR